LIGELASSGVKCGKLFKMTNYYKEIYGFLVQGDEGEHVKTMVACQQLDIPVRSPHDRKKKA
jgi:hypothetical protein